MELSAAAVSPGKNERPQEQSAQVPRRPAYGAPPPLLDQPCGPEILPEVMPGARHLGEGSRLPVIKARDKVLEQDFQTAGPADSFVGHRSKLVGHKHHFKKNVDWRIIAIQSCVGFCHTST